MSSTTTSNIYRQPPSIQQVAPRSIHLLFLVAHGLFCHSGGPRIITAVVQVIINFMVFGMCLKDAVAHPRVHDQLLYNGIPSTLFDKNVTEAGFEVSEITQQSLLRRGHNLVPTTYLGTCQAVSIDIETNALEAVSDVKKGGKPAGY